jgi:hypothetical protein
VPPASRAQPPNRPLSQPPNRPTGLSPNHPTAQPASRHCPPPAQVLRALHRAQNLALRAELARLQVREGGKGGAPPCRRAARRTARARAAVAPWLRVGCVPRWHAGRAAGCVEQCAGTLLLSLTSLSWMFTLCCRVLLLMLCVSPGRRAEWWWLRTRPAAAASGPWVSRRDTRGTRPAHTHTHTHRPAVVRWARNARSAHARNRPFFLSLFLWTRAQPPSHGGSRGQQPRKSGQPLDSSWREPRALRQPLPCLLLNSCQGFVIEVL